MDLDQLLDIVKTGAVLVGGLWVIYNYSWKRDRFPKSEFNLDINLIDTCDKYLLLEFIANIENKGMVRHYIDVQTFILKIRYITENDLITNHTYLKFRDADNQKIDVDFFHLSFPHSIRPDSGEDIFWLPKQWEYIFIDAGVKQKLSLPLSVPAEAKYILTKSEFKYKNDKKSGLHTAQSIFKVADLINHH
jgi:hypothetical protein